MHHFISVIGVDYDLDLAPYWIKHYAPCDFDTRTVFLHRETGGVPQSTVNLYVKNGFTVHCIDGPYSGGIVGAAYMENFIRNLPGTDFVTVADADEFQTMRDGSLIPYKVLCRDYDILHGLFEERYADTLSVCEDDPFIQYPHVEPYTGDYLKAFCPPYLDHIEWPWVYRCKIIAARANEQYRFYGMHTIENIKQRTKIMFGLKVIHFAWREGAKRKLAKKDWYKKVCRIDPRNDEIIPISKSYEKPSLDNELIPITKKELVKQFN